MEETTSIAHNLRLMRETTQAFTQLFALLHQSIKAQQHGMDSINATLRQEVLRAAELWAECERSISAVAEDIDYLHQVVTIQHLPELLFALRGGE